MSPDTPLGTARRALDLWTEVETAYDAIERRLAAGAWDGFEEITTHVATLEQTLQPLLASIAAMRAVEGASPGAELGAHWQELDERVAALARRQRLLERAAMSARDTTAARLVRTRIARSRVTGYTPLNPLTPRITSARV